MLVNNILMKDDSLIINIKVKTGLKGNYIKSEDNIVHIGVKSIPLKNQANIEIIKILSDLFGVKSSNVKIIHGKTNNLKTIEIINPRFISKNFL